jgi:integral membrane sensor domain MASE1
VWKIKPLLHPGRIAKAPSDFLNVQQSKSLTGSDDATLKPIHHADETLAAMFLAASLALLICLGSATLKAMSGEVVPIWMANGVLLAQLMVAMPPRRYFILLGGTLGFLAANLWQGESLYISCSFTGADMLEVCRVAICPECRHGR